jgi:hypothetical protein
MAFWDSQRGLWCRVEVLTRTYTQFRTPLRAARCPTADHVAKLDRVSSDVTLRVPSSPDALCWIVQEGFEGSRACAYLELEVAWAWVQA